jgi:hypothetical protein
MERYGVGIYGAREEYDDGIFERLFDVDWIEVGVVLG